MGFVGNDGLDIVDTLGLDFTVGKGFEDKNAAALKAALGGGLAANIKKALPALKERLSQAENALSSVQGQQCKTYFTLLIREYKEMIHNLEDLQKLVKRVQTDPTYKLTVEYIGEENYVGKGIRKGENEGLIEFSDKFDGEINLVGHELLHIMNVKKFSHPTGGAWSNVDSSGKLGKDTILYWYLKRSGWGSNKKFKNFIKRPVSRDPYGMEDAFSFSEDGRGQLSKFQELFRNIMKRDFPPASHKKLKDCCNKYLDKDVWSY